MCISLRIGLTTSRNRRRLRGHVLHLFIGTIIANMLHLEIPKLTLTIISVAQMRNGDGPSGVLPGTGHHPCEFVGEQGRFETHSELTELTSGGMLSPTRYDVMTLPTGVTMTWGVGFPQIPEDKTCAITWNLCCGRKCLTTGFIWCIHLDSGRSRQCVGSGEVWSVRVLSKLLFDRTPTAQSGNHEVRRDEVWLR